MKPGEVTSPVSEKIATRALEALREARRYPLVLASASPRRAKLLAQVGLDFEIHVPEVTEDADEPQRTPEEVALLHARAKACAVARRIPRRLVLGADTVVVHAGKVLGKPTDPSEAVAMLRALSGQKHQVITAVVIAVGAEQEAQVLAEHAEVTEVVFRALSETEIARYVASGEPMDKAGAYGIQGQGAVLVHGIKGCYFNVVGLPLSRTWEMLMAVGYNVGGEITPGRD